jgi:small RNA 2'-O-methyltransferase
LFSIGWFSGDDQREPTPARLASATSITTVRDRCVAGRSRGAGPVHLIDMLIVFLPFVSTVRRDLPRQLGPPRRTSGREEIPLETRSRQHTPVSAREQRDRRACAARSDPRASRRSRFQRRPALRASPICRLRGIVPRARAEVARYGTCSRTIPSVSVNASATTRPVIRHRQKRRRGKVPSELQHGLHTIHASETHDVRTPLHEERLDAVVSKLLDSRAATVLDLGCGSGSLLRRLVAHAQFAEVMGVDVSAEALLRAERCLRSEHAESTCEWRLHHGSFTEPEDSWAHFEAAAMVETLEHVPPEQLSLVERAVFSIVRPRTVVVTTPNREYNRLYGMEEGEMRHADHEFEWCRARFRAWASGVAERNGYRVWFEDVGRADPLFGSPTQMAVFGRREAG